MKTTRRCVVFLTLWAAATGDAAFAEPVGQVLLRPTVVGHHFATAVAGVGASVRINDPAKARLLILCVEAEAAAPAKIFGMDFVLAYRHRGGGEDRDDCSAMACGSTGDTESIWRVGNYCRLDVPQGSVRLWLAFAVESDVTAATLHLLGGPAITVNFGAERSFSVYLATNRDTDALATARQAIEQCGVDLTAATASLNTSIRGVTVKHARGDEVAAAANRLAARLEAALGIKPVVEPIGDDMTGAHDLLVWVGR